MPDLRQGEDIPVYIWYENYPTHAADEYKGRVSGVSPESSYGQASLNLTNIRESDQGWYECKVVFLNRAPNQNNNGTWFHLDVHGECEGRRAPWKWMPTPRASLALRGRLLGVRVPQVVHGAVVSRGC